jgi:hypothetical protein
MEAALRRRLEGVTGIVIDQSQQTADVEFAQGDRVFSPGDFRAAIGEAKVTVLGMRIDACGTIEQSDNERWLRAGKNRFRFAEDAKGADGETLCVSGRLNDRQGPDRMEITEITEISLNDQ